MSAKLIESLESRRLLSGGLTPNGSPVTVAALGSQNSPVTACKVGSGNTFIAYVSGNKGFAKGDVVDGTIVSPTGKTVVAPFAINPVSQTVNQYGTLASVEDSSGNAVLVYSTLGSLFQGNLYIARISSAGKVIDAPKAVAPNSSGDNQMKPALVAGPGGSVAVAYEDDANASNTTTIFAGVFNSSDSAAFTAKQISPASTNKSGAEILNYPAVTYNPVWGLYMAAWTSEELNSTIQYTQVGINDRTFSPTGTLGIDPTVIVVPKTSTAENNVTGPAFFQAGGKPALAFVINKFNASLSFQGSVVEAVMLNANGSIIGSPKVAYTTTSSLEIYNISTNPAIPGIQPAIVRNHITRAVTTPLTSFFMNVGAYSGGGYSSMGACSLSFNTAAFQAVLGTFNYLVRAAVNGEVWYTGPDLIYSDTVNGITEVMDQPIKQPTTLPAWSAADATAAKGKTTITFIVSLDSMASGNASVELMVPKTDYTDEQTLDCIAIGGKAGMYKVTVTIKSTRPAAEGTITVTLQNNTDNTSIGSATATGTIAAK